MTEHGAIIIDAVQVATTNRCPHCGGHFLAAKGNLEAARQQLGEIARPKTHCLKCNRLTCGRPGCDPAIACIPIEARLEHAEGTRTRYDDAIADAEQRGVSIL
jgi:hypothetical protein